VNVECKDTQTFVWSSQYNINVAIKLSEADTNKTKVIARLKHKMFNSISCTCSIRVVTLYCPDIFCYTFVFGF
jgi:hypothetical protein